ncbi:hypothetical protein F4810DRAFT_686736 [Camillea tinctor]|nr:hypothetical protein F4810DRAFT_686736 [Camillea tinctor]
MTAYIRPYRETDFDACAHICRATLPPSLSSSPDAARLSPYLWTHPYTYLSPETCHVLAVSGADINSDSPSSNTTHSKEGQGQGLEQVVGYCIGTPSIQALLSSYPRYISAILLPSAVPPPPQLHTREPWFLPPSPSPSSSGEFKVNPLALAQLIHNPSWQLLSGKSKALLRAAPATMHVDILPPWQGRGWGRRLVGAFEGSVRAATATNTDDINTTTAAATSVRDIVGGEEKVGEEGGGEEEEEKEEEEEGENDKETGVVRTTGIHIGVAGDNAQAVGFYEKLGFRVVDVKTGVMVEGEASSIGERRVEGEEEENGDDTIWMVKYLGEDL